MMDTNINKTEPTIIPRNTAGLSAFCKGFMVGCCRKSCGKAPEECATHCDFIIAAEELMKEADDATEKTRNQMFDKGVEMGEKYDKFPTARLLS